ncbi:hypothetical protein [Streptomyces lydicus]|uniref:hypothetical protein n=1 Tax=Streptomyces lydicus TaxID=47763 RepID=UPI00382349AC
MLERAVGELAAVAEDFAAEAAVLFQEVVDAVVLGVARSAGRALMPASQARVVPS